MPDNKKLVGDVYIDGKTNQLLSKFITGLFQSYQGHLNGFNADKLDGHHYDEIEGLIQHLDETKLSSIVIGGTEFSATDTESKLLSFSDVSYQGNEKFDWETEVLNFDITTALNRLYASVAAELSKKVNAEKVDPNDTSTSPRMKVLSDNNYTDNDKNILYDLKNDVSNNFVEYVDENAQKHNMFNSQLTNGLRFILISQTDYDALSSEFKNYWRNVFIIKDPNEIPDSLEYSSPLQYDLKEGYDFRIARDDALASDYTFEDDGTDRDIWVQIKHKWSNQWINLIPLNDMLAGSDFSADIIRVIENDEALEYNEVAMASVLNHLLKNPDNPNYVNLNMLSADYKDDFVHQILKNGTALDVTTENGFSNVDIGTVFDTEFTNINDRISAVTNDNGTGALDVQINTLNQTVNGLNTQLNSGSNSVVSQLSSINTTLGEINQAVSDIKSNVQALGTWEKVTLQGLYDPTRLDDNGNVKFESRMFYNQKLQLAWVKLKFRAYWNFPKSKTVSVEDKFIPERNYKGKQFGNSKIPARPHNVISSLNLDHPTSSFCFIATDGQVYISSTYPSGVQKDFYVSAEFFYKYSTLDW